MAILCGMSVAALVAGNTVIMKPAEQSSATAYALFERMQRAGFLPGVVQFLPGPGEDVGAFLVDHPAIAQIAFTGSKAVGLGIVERAAKTQPGQRQVKRVVCEIGGKNAIVVDADADLDEAVAGILYSAFGYAGQKCSACSRVIAVGGAYAPLVDRLAAACADLVVGPADDPACQVPPVVDEHAYRRLTGIIASPGDGARPLFVGTAPSGGWFVPPALFEVTDARHRLMQEELFGPVVALMRADTFETAIEIANATEFALTGAVFARRPSHLNLARRAFRVGNLYLNRGCTGSMVGRQAFGGFQMSGIGLKAGGPGYLRQFADPRSVTENMTRHGFSPDVSL
jgi:RHH-type proline utilization regulon transcriptional repressor/proline dehydrogenase/delta 1-pyrroline-5-carboxylate dehydrogenase